MTNLVKRSLALILALILCLSLLPVTVVPVSAASYIYNWGTRGEVATTLSQNALAFYTGSNTYDALSSLAGGTGTSDAPDSNLYKALQNLMSAAHTKQTSYDETRSLFRYTDCQNGGGKISSFYSGAEIGPDWDGGSTWNREHTWPNSKGLEGRDEDDIMMLRPTASSENSSRGNTAYGRSSGYYDPNNASGGKYNLHGDVARIFLYVYVRWGITNGNGEADSNGKAYTTWGSQGVIESLDVLLDWMAEDPVDTWEMGRNDSVQSITGTRNVFVDYPELAFQLFGEAVPATMTTPSGKSSSDAQPDAPTEEPEVEVPKGPQTVDLTIKATTGELAADSKSIVWEDGGVSFTNRKASSTTAIRTSDGDHFRVYANSAVDFAAPGNITKIVVTCTSSSYATVLKNSAGSEATVSGSVVTIVPTAAATTYTIAKVTAQVRLNKVAITYEVGGGEVEVCTHANTTTTTVEATCTKEGSTIVTCVDCNETVETIVIAVLGHNYVDGVCSVCGVDDPYAGNDVLAAFTFKDGTSSEWKDGNAMAEATATYTHNGYTLTFTNFSRVYAGGWDTFKNGFIKFGTSSAVGTLTFTVPDEVTSVELHLAKYKANTTKYSINGGNAVALTKSANDGEYDVVIVDTTETKTITLSTVSGGVRMVMYAVIYKGAATACEHTNTKVEGAADATCSAKGHTGTTVCVDCGATVNAGSEIDYLPHTYENGACAACGIKAPETAVATKQAYKFGMIQQNVSPTKLYYLNGAMSGYYMDTATVADEAVDVYVEETEGGYYFYTYINAVKHYINIVVNGTYVNGVYAEDASTVYTFDAEKNTLVATANGELYCFGTRNDNTYTTVGPVKVTDNGFYCMLYKFVEGNPDEPTCQHTNTKVEGAADATCTAEGHTGATVCVDCGVTVNAGEVIGKLDHNYVEGVCSACGEEKPLIATIVFDADKANRTQYDTTIQVWEQNGITVTNNKAASTNDVGDYANPARFYKGSDLKIEYPGMAKIEIETTGKDYATAYQNSITDANATVVVDGTKVTITFAQPVNSFVIEKLSAQARARSITITAVEVEEEADCEHSFVDGVCSACGHKLGDIDGSDALTYNDAVYLLLYTMFPEEYPLNGAYANVDGDQDVDQDDAVYLLLNVLFGDNFYPLYTTPVLPKNEEEAQG